MKLREIVSYLEIDRRKFTEYALNTDNPKGMNKALLFQRHLGYTRDNYESLTVGRAHPTSVSFLFELTILIEERDSVALRGSVG